MPNLYLAFPQFLVFGFVFQRYLMLREAKSLWGRAQSSITSGPIGARQRRCHMRNRALRRRLRPPPPESVSMFCFGSCDEGGATTARGDRPAGRCQCVIRAGIGDLLSTSAVTPPKIRRRIWLRE